jgi:HEAT repeat protein
MHSPARWMPLTVIATSLALRIAAPLCAADPPESRSSDGQPPAPALQQVLDRLGRVEKELLELRLSSGKVPADKNAQRLLAVTEVPYLGTVHTGGQNSRRFLALKLMLVNLTDQSISLKREDFQLAVDAQDYPIKDPPQQLRNGSIPIGPQQVQVRTLSTPKEINLTSGGSASTWALFPELPPGNHVPRLVLKIKYADKSAELDINATRRDALGMKVERIGPRGSLGLISLSGPLDTVNVGALIDEIDRLAADKLVRLVIHWKEGATVFQPLTNWLTNVVWNLRIQQPFVDGQFPALPASLREVHLAEFPGENYASQRSAGVPRPYNPNQPPSRADRIHKTLAEAVTAALRSAYETLPRDEVLQTIQSGGRLERVAALIGGGGRLAVDKLPLLLKLADDEDALIQQAAISALGHFGEQSAIDKLVACARKNVPALSPAAIASLAESRYAAAHQTLLELLQNEPPESKKNVVRILAAFPRPVWSDAIYEFIKDSRSGLNVEALQALVQVGHPRLISVLEEALRGGDRNLAQAAFGIVAARTDRESEDLAVGYTLEQLKTTNATPQMLQLLNRVKDRRALPLLMTQFPKHENKTNLIQTLALLGDSDTVKFLTEKYDSLQSHEKGEVLRALSRIDQPKFRELAGQALLAGDASLVQQAAQGLQEDGGPEAVKLLAAALDASTNNTTTQYLCNALSQIGAPAGRAALVKARDSDNQSKREHAVRALQTLQQRSPGFPHMMQARNLSNDRKWKEAIEQYDVAIQLDPALSDAFAERGHAYLHLDKTAEAARDFDRAIDLDPYSSLAITGSCITSILAGGPPADAIAKLEGARSKFPRESMFLYNAACVYGRAFEKLKKEQPSAERDKLLEQYQQASLNDLKASIQQGFQDFDFIKKDPDLAPFRELPEFQHLTAGPPEGEVRREAGRRVPRVR